jgi:hypothetical protein
MDSNHDSKLPTNTVAAEKPAAAFNVCTRLSVAESVLILLSQEHRSRATRALYEYKLDRVTHRAEVLGFVEGHNQMKALVEEMEKGKKDAETK